jgi:hypothetical protein
MDPMEIIILIISIISIVAAATAIPSFIPFLLLLGLLSPPHHSSTLAGAIFTHLLCHCPISSRQLKNTQNYI